ncbi:protein-disulfide reductase DsbD domain-containing protein [Paracoccus beibuensis]|uniref:protein-disulfide reductase DsbD domain-containing protein n=1 Tax=Paracoccus beibuensis TaxID=547602 RepID=UPI00223FFE88|nr:protein-disulfide reductase DsbD domain-containing protein [Paracoccus beibuensis]
MTGFAKLVPALILCLAGWPAAGQMSPPQTGGLPPGLTSARLLPGWTDKTGNRIAALELRLEPGWKTYWRSPGDTGLPPHFDWQNSRNLAEVTLHWPAPQAIRSGDAVEMGYHDRLVLPFTARPAVAREPVDLRVQVDLGLCRDICVPGHLDLTAAGPAVEPDPVIVRAIASEPQRLDLRPGCTVTEIGDGLRVAVDLPRTGADLAAVELANRPEIWVSGAQILTGGERPQAVVEMVGPSGQPFDLNTDGVRLTLVAPEGAVETMGCDPRG